MLFPIKLIEVLFFSKKKLNTMKLTILLFSLLSITAYSQVGIGTDTPTATLDVNGSLRVRSIIHETNEDTISDSILVISNLGTIKRVEAAQIIHSVIKSAVKGKFSSASLVNLTLVSGLATMPFDSEDFDLNDEYDTTTHSFTAKQDGIYSLHAQIKASSAISVSTDFGISIYKNNVLECKNSFANIGILSINATPPIRSVKTLVSLTAGDIITFKATSSLVNLNIIGNTAESYFTILQVR